MYNKTYKKFDQYTQRSSLGTSVLTHDICTQNNFQIQSFVYCPYAPFPYSGNLVTPQTRIPNTASINSIGASRSQKLYATSEIVMPKKNIGLEARDITNSGTKEAAVTSGSCQISEPE